MWIMIHLTFEQKIKLADYFVYACLWGIVIWIVLKLLGIINTTPLLELLPAILAVASAFVFVGRLSNHFGKLESTLERAVQDVCELKNDMKEVKKEVKQIDNRIISVEHRLTDFEHQLNSIEKMGPNPQKVH